MLSEGYKLLMSEFRMAFDPGDLWGTIMDWWFATAETLYHNSEIVPSEWCFIDSPMHDDNWPANEDYADNVIDDYYGAGEVTGDDLRTFGNVLTRYAYVVQSSGKDY